ncbi:F0F1 ATP synthase subunit gamma [Candidatus Saccharibacteria bacterium]|nr:F0F1 ATP synthase subunit gamma [Candidatus Saccharibacteria bacterium]MCA9337404.1 F0F1 ATP synthase subunit gamma [Candidatus Saccharibacteria bacterium]
MRSLQEIQAKEQSMQVLVGLTSVFEGIASLRIAQIKSQVLQSQAFFGELWHMYTQMREGTAFQFGRGEDGHKLINKELVIIITAEGGFSGDIDEKLISLVLQNYDEKHQDIIVIGHHGAIRLAHSGVHFKKYYRLPTRDVDINVTPIIKDVQQYRSTTVFYQTYVSLGVQDVKRIELSTAVQEQGKHSKRTGDEISEATYIFEPSTQAVVNHLESSMLHIALSQVILESKLAQYASRFRAMNAAHTKAKDSLDGVFLEYSRAKRGIKDERLKEIINGLRKVQTA